MIWPVLLLAVLVRAETPVTTEPFWKSKEKVYRRIQEERAIIVSVKTEKTSSPLQSLVFSGGGQMRAPLEYSFREALQVDNLRKAIDYIKEVNWEGERLHVRSRAYGFEANMWFRIQSTANRAIHFEIVQGTLKGTKGDLNFSSVSDDKTEVGIAGHYDYEHFPLPKMFAEFGIEVILQRMAIRMRGFLEDKYQTRSAVVESK